MGKGFATEAAEASRAYAYDVLGWDTAISQVDPANDASKSVALRLGASFEKPMRPGIRAHRGLAPPRT